MLIRSISLHFLPIVTDQQPPSSRRKIFLLYGAPTILYALGILGLSSIPDLSGPELPIIPFDKAAHVLEYGGLAILVLRSVSQYATGMFRATKIVGSFAAVAVFAILDELYQSTVPGRSSDPSDLLADALGGALGIVLALLWRRW